MEGLCGMAFRDALKCQNLIHIQAAASSKPMPRQEIQGFAVMQGLCYFSIFIGSIINVVRRRTLYLFNLECEHLFASGILAGYQGAEDANKYQRDKDRDRALVTLIQKHFIAHDAVSMLQELCEEWGIPCKFANYFSRIALMLLILSALNQAGGVG